MAAIALKLTDAGLAAVQAASGSDPTVISHLGLTEAAFDYAPTLTALPGEFKRLDVASGVAAAPNITHLTVYDVSAEVWSARGMGLFLEDGTLFAVHSSPEPFLAKAGLAFALLAFDIAFEADLAANIAYGNAIFAYPPATREISGVVELATVEEAKAGTDPDRAVTPQVAKASILDWLGYAPVDLADYIPANILAMLLTVDGAGSGLDCDRFQGANIDTFLRIEASSLGTSGYMAFVGGFKIVWGQFTISADAYANVTFPIGFEQIPAVVFPTIGGGGDTAFNQNLTLTARTTAGFTAWQSGDIAVTAPFIAVGK